MVPDGSLLPSRPRPDEQQGEMKKAAEQLRRSDSLHPDMPETIFALGRALVINDPDAAERALERVISIERESPLAREDYLPLFTVRPYIGQLERGTKSPTLPTITDIAEVFSTVPSVILRAAERSYRSARKGE